MKKLYLNVTAQSNKNRKQTNHFVFELAEKTLNIQRVLKLDRDVMETWQKELYFQGKRVFVVANL